MQGTEYTNRAGNPDPETGSDNPLKHYLEGTRLATTPLLPPEGGGLVAHGFSLHSSTLFLFPGSTHRTSGSDRVQELDLMLLLNR